MGVSGPEKLMRFQHINPLLRTRKGTVKKFEAGPWLRVASRFGFGLHRS